MYLENIGKRTFLESNYHAVTHIKLRFRHNLEGFHETYRLAFTVFTFTAILDAFSTYCFMYIHGTELEVHPLVRWLADNLGVFTGPFIGAAIKVSSGYITTVYLRRYVRTIMYSASIIYTYAFFHNLAYSGLLNL